MKKILHILRTTPLHIYALISILVFAYLVRSFGRDWDGFTHMHPDERMLMMVTEKMSFPDKLYPDFFNYGTLPIYILKGISQIIASQYSPISPITAYGPSLLSLGRLLSTIFDLGTIIAIYSITRLLFEKHGKSIPLFASAIYAAMFFPIQNSHFFVVDVHVTFFISWATFFMVFYIKKRNILSIVLQAAFIGFAIASKFTAVLFAPGFFLTVIFAYFSAHPRKFKTLALHLFIWIFVSFSSFAAAMPYALLPPSGILTKFARSTSDNTLVFSQKAMTDTWREFEIFFEKDTFPSIRFLRDMKEQTRMNSNPYVFPYTLQYAGTAPYIYYLKNIAIWGVGPFISSLFFLAIIFFIKNNFDHFVDQKSKNGEFHSLILQSKRIFYKASKMPAELKLISVFYFLTFFVFFAVIGRSAVKFMRYMLPLYPIFAILAGYGLFKLFELKSKKYPILLNTSRIAFVILAVLWSFAFINIYSKKNTRTQATEWIVRNIPPDSTLGTEHWDDRVPIHSGERFRFEEITMYDRPDNEYKWMMMRQKLEKIDYYVVASNRLYAPLQRLTDCNLHKDSCYPIASKFYADLLSNKTQFKKVAEFTNYPHLGFLTIPDDGADESFTVYDHPKIMIFKK